MPRRPPAGARQQPLRQRRHISLNEGPLAGPFFGLREILHFGIAPKHEGEHIRHLHQPGMVRLDAECRTDDLVQPGLLLPPVVIIVGPAADGSCPPVRFSAQIRASRRAWTVARSASLPPREPAIRSISRSRTTCGRRAARIGKASVSGAYDIRGHSVRAAAKISVAAISMLPFALANRRPNGSCTFTSRGCDVAQSNTT